MERNNDIEVFTYVGSTATYELYDLYCKKETFIPTAKALASLNYILEKLWKSKSISLYSWVQSNLSVLKTHVKSRMLYAC